MDKETCLNLLINVEECEINLKEINKKLLEMLKELEKEEKSIIRKQ